MTAGRSGRRSTRHRGAGPKDRCPLQLAGVVSLPKDKLFWNALHFTKKTVKVSFLRGCSHRAHHAGCGGDNDGGGSLCPKCEDVSTARATAT